MILTTSGAISFPRSVSFGCKSRFLILLSIQRKK
jgi:hypothetical protein